MPKVPFWVFIVIAIMYFSAIRVDVMDIDASQYAEISREMLKSGDYLHIFDRGIDYLDKPPLLFWVSALSMKVFGINNFGYKFPSILFALWAIFATYRLAKNLYDDKTGRMAALVLATCQGMFLMTNDIRCDTILMSCVITGIWLMREWYVQCKWYYLVLSFIAIAFGMMAKGPIALMAPVFCFASDWALKRQWKNFFRPAYLIGIIVMAVLLLPMSIGLYQQFDLHPEKIVNGVKGVSGLRFFYWSQSFGRITGESPWKNDVNIFFLLQNMLWSFLPWILLLVAAIVTNVIQLIKQKFRLQPQQEWITTGGFLLSYLALGSSAYQLPHYIFIAFPLAAIITAKFMADMIEQRKYQPLFNFFQPVHAIITMLLLIVSLVLITYIFPADVPLYTLWIAFVAVWLYVALKKDLRGKLLWLPAAAMIIVNFFATNHLYTTLLGYQAGSQTGRYIHDHSIAPADVAIYKMDDPLNSIQFYAQGSIVSIDALPQLQHRAYLLTMEPGLRSLKQNGYTFNIIKKAQCFKVSELTLPFLIPSTRDKEVKDYFLVKIN